MENWMSVIDERYSMWMREAEMTAHMIPILDGFCTLFSIFVSGCCRRAIQRISNQNVYEAWHWLFMEHEPRAAHRKIGLPLTSCSQPGR